MLSFDVRNTKLLLTMQRVETDDKKWGTTYQLLIYSYFSLAQHQGRRSIFLSGGGAGDEFQAHMKVWNNAPEKF